ncbi:MAG: flagellar hook-length control protein FliK [Planctomycetota bacterium]
MPDSVQSPPTLLTLTAPKRNEPAPAESAPGFAEELEAASDSAPAPAADQQPDRDDAEATRSDSPESSSTRTDEETTAESVVPSESETPEDELLVVSLAVETLVLETPPDVELPEEASTTVEVSLGSSIEAVSPEVTTEAGSVEGVPNTDSTVLPLLPVDEGVPEVEVSSNTLSTPVEADGQLTPDADLNEDVPVEVNIDTEVDEIGFDSDITGTVVAVTRSTAAVDDDGELAPETPFGENVAQAAETAIVSPVEPTGDAAQEQNSETPDKRPEPAERVELPVTPTQTEGIATTTAATETTAELSVDRPTVPTPTAATETRPTSPLTSPAPAAVESPPAIDPTRFVSRVARAFDLAQERGGGPIELRLSPPELGSMQVKIELKEGVMTASLDVETPAARNALLDNLPALRDRLEQQQIRIEKFDVDVRDDSGRQAGEEQSNDNSSRDRSDERREATRDAPAPTEAVSQGSDPAAAPTIHFGDDAINLVA